MLIIAIIFESASDEGRMLSSIGAKLKPLITSSGRPLVSVVVHHGTNIPPQADAAGLHYKEIMNNGS